MNHMMSLYERPFEQIKCGEKTIEIRCNDPKRRLLSVGDTVTFRKLPELSEELTVEVLALYPYRTFKELYESFDFAEFGCEGRTMQQMLDGTRKTYSKEKEDEFGALGIRIKLK